MQAGQAQFLVAGENRHRLDAQPLAGLPGRHQQQRAGLLARGVFDRMVVTQRNPAAFHEHLFQGGNEPIEGKVLIGLGLIQDIHVPFRGALAHHQKASFSKIIFLYENLFVFSRALY